MEQEIYTHIEQETKVNKSVDRDFKHLFKWIGALLIALLIFFAGMIVGRVQTRFTFSHMRVGEGYMPMGGMPRIYNTPGILGQGDVGMMPNSNGVKGTISAINNNQITVQGSNGVSENITITASTIIKNQNQDLKISDLKNGQQVVVLGDPDNQGGINAKFIGIEK